MKHERPTGIGVWVLAPLAGLWLACVLSFVASQAAAAQLTRPHPYLNTLCVWARNGQAGLWWNNSLSPSRIFGNARRYNAVCVALPWAPSLPVRGRPFVEAP